ncbi:ComEC/Rec2 family competence protein [Flavobacteriaceae bacterium LMO-SS05]
MKLLNFVILKLTLCLSAGILFARFGTISLNHSLSLTFVLLIVLALVFFVSKNQLKKTIWFGLVAFMATISLGTLVYNLHNQQNFKHHYSNYISSDNNTEDRITFRIREKLKPGNFYNKYIIDILKVNEETVLGKSLLNVQIDSTQPTYKVDDVFITSSPLKELIQPLNPNQFNYKNYLEKQYVYHQIFTENHSLLKLTSNKHTLFGYTNAWRETINTKLKRYHFKADELAIINALLLGQRQDISEEIYNSYTKAGAIHILAVSGLHVGIVLLLLNFVFKPIEYIRQGKLIKVLVILSILWGFAIIAGLSASVTRAVTMFSIVAIAMHWKRPTNVYNTLAISIFFLLLFKPMFLFDVGFQLSYLAVLSIVVIQPLLYELWKPKFKVYDFFWNIFTVTIAAQFGIVPISLYYFHQFPGLFFISNLLIIPFLGIILGYGIILILLALINLLPEYVATLYGHIITSMNSIVDWVARQEQFLFKDISISMLQVFVWYVLLITFVKFLKQKTFINLRLMLISVLLLQGVFIYNSYTNSTHEFIIFHKSRFTVLGEKTNRELKVYSNLDRLARAHDPVIKNFKIGNFITHIKEDTITTVYQINGKKLLVIDSFGVYNIKTFKPNYVLLRNSPKINLNRLIDSLQPEFIIADGSNYKSYIDRWETTCTKQKLPFHKTSEKGAFMIR